MREIKKGTVYWVTGLSGAGKTTIGSLLYQELKRIKNEVVILDGDVMRKVYDSHDFSIEGRNKVAYQNMRLCKMLSDQGIDVVCCVIGMRDEYRAWNRRHIENYIEIFIKVSMDVLIKRDSKGLYKKALAGEAKNVWGVDIVAEEPKEADITIYNEGEMTPEYALRTIMDKMSLQMEKRN